MNRQALGALVLLLTVVSAVVVPHFIATPIAGTPVAEVIVPPPVVGDCVLQDPNTPAANTRQIPELTYGSCGRQHFGEIVEVFDNSKTFPRVRLDQISTPDPSVCQPAVNSYLAVDQVLTRVDRGDYLSVSFGPWEPVATGSVGLLGPSALQQAVGQHWIACVTETNDGTAVSGTVRNAFSGGTLPNSYSVCADSLTSARNIDCSLPHHAELFASTPISNSLPSPADLAGSCAGFVQYLTGRMDIASARGLQVATESVYYGITGHPIPGQSNPVQVRPVQAFCGVTTTGTARLTGTIFALHDRPLPLS